MKPLLHRQELIEFLWASKVEGENRVVAPETEVDCDGARTQLSAHLPLPVGVENFVTDLPDDRQRNSTSKRTRLGTYAERNPGSLTARRLASIYLGRHNREGLPQQPERLFQRSRKVLVAPGRSTHGSQPRR